MMAFGLTSQQTQPIWPTRAGLGQTSYAGCLGNSKRNRGMSNFVLPPIFAMRLEQNIKKLETSSSR